MHRKIFWHLFLLSGLLHDVHADVPPRFHRPPTSYHPHYESRLPRHFDLSPYRRLFPDFDCYAVPEIFFDDPTRPPAIRRSSDPSTSSSHHVVDFPLFLRKVQAIFHRFIYAERDAERRVEQVRT